MAWFLVIVAGYFRDRFRGAAQAEPRDHPAGPTADFAICALISFALLTYALCHLEVGPAYVVWTGIGAAGTALADMAVFGESVSAAKLISIGLILAGITGLNLSGVTPP